MTEMRKLLLEAEQAAQRARDAGADSRRIISESREIQQWTARVQGRLAAGANSYLTFERKSNWLLALLPRAEFEPLASQLEGVQFRPDQVLYRAGGPIDHVFFPVTGVLSVVVSMDDGARTEVGIIGNEGMAGLAAVAGGNTSPYNIIAQTKGQGLRMPVRDFHAALAKDSVLKHVLIGYNHAFSVLLAYQAACNGLHPFKRRCCRWLLSRQDRSGADPMVVTHDNLAQSLGVRRATVTVELGELREQGLIANERGQIQIVDRPALQTLACECYGAMNASLTRLYSAPTGLPDLSWPPTASSSMPGIIPG